MKRSMADVERPTATARLAAGTVEYRLERRGDAAIVAFHGGHMRAGLPLGEDVFADLGYTILAPTRPGYGRTPLDTAASPAGFADVTRQLCDYLGIDQVAAVTGISAGGRTAAAMAARHPELAQRLILQSAVGFLSWPDRRTRLAANVAFTAGTERMTWAAVRALLRLAPTAGLRAMLGDLSTEPPGDVLAALSSADRDMLVAMFSHMRSGRGFRNDLRELRESTPEFGPSITQPTLVIASRADGSVPFSHAVSLADAIPRAELVVSGAGSHFIWLGGDYGEVEDRIRRFLTAE